MTTRIKFGQTPPDWSPTLPWFALALAVVAPLFLVVATLGHATPTAFWSVAMGGSTAVAFLTVVFLQVVYFIAVWLILLRRDARGLTLLLGGFAYGAMMLNAMAIALLVIGAWQVVLATLLIAGFSIWGLITVNRKVAEAALPPIAAALLRKEDGETILSTPDETATRLISAALAGKRGLLPTLIEYGGAFLVMAVGPGLLLPVAVVGDLATTGAVAWLMWFLCVIIFLAARGLMNRQLLHLRAMRIGG